ncbi:DNA ligase 1 [Phtheirospermum japonicum]|uniref:DNA ligase 1 n=1 Tax=Phtheirospermum japonicum TaxID=374723 RepID=A0A830DCW8_9LAMI|nr:DNA ligase 1 [Phtheirospermum japonicum]
MSEITVNVCIFAFDILYLNGQQLLQQQLNVRREHLYHSFQEELGFFQFATAITSNDLEEIQEFLDDALKSGSEGLIIKTLNKDATYEPSKRSNNWIKLKKDYMDSIGDSLDLVPIAAFDGCGKRTGVYGSFLLACYDSDKEEYQSICKVGESYYRYSDTIGPDVWFEPSEEASCIPFQYFDVYPILVTLSNAYKHIVFTHLQSPVWEVKAADLTISPHYHAAIGVVDPDKGISLRFPRLLRVRDDKKPEQATSSDMVAHMYKEQKYNPNPVDNGYKNED